MYMMCGVLLICCILGQVSVSEGKYTFYGEKNLDYLDSPELYQAIFKQIYNNNQLRM